MSVNEKATSTPQSGPEFDAAIQSLTRVERLLSRRLIVRQMRRSPRARVELEQYGITGTIQLYSAAALRLYLVGVAVLACVLAVLGQGAAAGVLFGLLLLVLVAVLARLTTASRSGRAWRASRASLADARITDRCFEMLLDLCRRALEGTLSYETLDAAVPAASGVALCDAITRDLWDGIEHTPSKLLSRTTDMPKWAQTEEYRVLYADTLVLEVVVAGADVGTGDALRRHLAGMVDQRGERLTLAEIKAEMERLRRFGLWRLRHR